MPGRDQPGQGHSQGDAHVFHAHSAGDRSGEEGKGLVGTKDKLPPPGIFSKEMAARKLQLASLQPKGKVA